MKMRMKMVREEEKEKREKRRRTRQGFEADPPGWFGCLPGDTKN